MKKIYTLSYNCSYTSESTTKVFLCKEDSLREFNKVVVNEKKEIEELLKLEDVDTNEDEMLLGEKAKHFSYYDGEKAHQWNWEEHEIGGTEDIIESIEWVGLKQAVVTIVCPDEKEGHITIKGMCDIQEVKS